MAWKERRPIAGRFIGASVTVPAISRSTSKDCSGHIPEEKTPQRRPTPSEECAEAFQRYLREDRALSRATEINYLPFIRSFLKDRFGNGPAKLSQLRADDV